MQAPAQSTRKKHSVTSAKPDCPAIEANVDKVAEYPGGPVAMRTFIAINMHYPDSVRTHNRHGKVVLEILVDKQGEVSDIKILRDIGVGCGAAAVEVTKKMPRWVPAKLQGKSVCHKQHLTIMF